MEIFTLKAHTKAFLFALMIASIYAFTYAVKEISALKEDGKAGGSRNINFIENKFSYLNITAVSRRFVERSLQCALMCLESLPCFSFNLAAFPDNNDNLLCEHLLSDKYNNSEKFIPSSAFHHFSIWSPCSAVVCRNNGKCVALYKENSYVCLCKEGFIGRNCETVVDECKSYITLNAKDRNVRFQGRKTCDNNLKTEWYRFQGQAGRQLPTTCPPIHRCKTDLPGWMNGKHPNVEDGIVQREVCFHGYDNCCHKTTTIDVRNCSAYFVYRLKKVSFCDSRYCGTG